MTSGSYIYRPLRGRALLRVPFARGNRRWLRDALGCRPEWDSERRAWLVAREHLQRAIALLAETHGRVALALEYRLTDRCDIRCQAARGDDCVCSCLGEHHGGGRAVRGWRVVGDTTLVDSHVHVRRYVVTAADLCQRPELARPA